MTDPTGPAVRDAAPAVDAAPDRPPMRRPSYLVAIGGVFIVFELPMLASLGRLLAIGLVVAGILTLRQLAVDPVARRHLNAAAILAVVVALTVVVLSLLALTADAGTQPPTWAEATAIAQTVLGILGSVLLTAGMTRELAGRGHPDAKDAWWLAALAVVLIHGPILVAALLAHPRRPPGRGLRAGSHRAVPCRHRALPAHRASRTPQRSTHPQAAPATSATTAGLTRNRQRADQHVAPGPARSERCRARATTLRLVHIVKSSSPRLLDDEGTPRVPGNNRR